MGFLDVFRDKPTETIDPRLEAAFRPVDDQHSTQHAKKILARESAAIRAELDRTDEHPFMLVYSMNLGYGIGVLTTSGVFASRKRRVENSFAWHEIAETRLYTVAGGQGANKGMFVGIETHSSRLDFNPNDPMRFSKILTLQVNTPRIANEVCSYIDQHLGG